MQETYSIDITTPCSQKFNTFQKTPVGGFCGSCQKEVIDFTKMSNSEVLNYFKNTTGKSCGQFYPEQLKTYTDSSNSAKKATPLGLGLASFSLLSLLSVNQAKAQNKKELPKQETKIVVNQNSEIKKPTTTSISGTVIADNLPLPGVNVYLKGTNIGAVTDFDGVFKIIGEIKPNDILVFSSIGFITNEYIVPEDFSNGITLNLKGVISMKKGLTCVVGEVNVKKVYSSKRSLWQKIKNWF